MSKKALSSAVVLALAATALSGCIINPGPMPEPPVPVTPNGANRAPIIAALDYSPKTGVKKDDVITFTVVANDPEGDLLQYNWSATKGTLTSNSGQVAGWKPTRADGAIEPGLSTVTVIISDGRQTTTGSVNILIDADGHASVQNTVTSTPAPQTTVAPTAAPTVAPTTQPSVAPSAAPSAEPTTAPSPSADAINGTVLFQDNFDGNDDLKLWKPYSAWGDLLAKVAPGGAQGSAAGVIFNDGEDEVKAGMDSLNQLSTGEVFDLSTTKYPRVRFYTKNPALPASSVTLQAFWVNEVGAATAIAPEYSGSKEWGMKEYNLSPFKAKPGRLMFQVRIQRENAKFGGVMFDNVTLYDANQ